MSDDLVLLSIDGPIATITINRPDALNALNVGVLQGLRRVLEDLAALDDVRAAVLTGAGNKAFVAGADITVMSDMGPRAALRFADLGHAVGNLMETLDIPVIAAVNGFALGGGCEIALCCDFIYASDTARFGQPEVKLGLIPGFGGTQRLTRRVGPGLAAELVLTGRIIKADEAHRIGIVNAVFPAADLLEKTLATARKIAQQGPLAVAAAKRAIKLGAGRDPAAAFEIEKQAFAGLFATDDAREGMKAFVEKRPADFQGR